MNKSTNSPLKVSENRNSYSEAAQQATHEGLKELSAHLFIHKNRCHLKNSNAEALHQFGYLTLENALAEHWLVENSKGGPALLYATVDDLVNGGWVVD